MGSQKASAKNKGGRPDTFTQEKADAIIDRVAGPESLRAICEDIGVSIGTFLGWCSDRPDVAEQYARAKRMQAETLASELLEIADTPPGTTDMGATDSGAVAHARLRVDTRKWILSKMLPKVYGDKLALGGADDMPAIKTDSLVHVDPSEAYKQLLGLK